MKITRRDFLKTTTTVLAVASLSRTIPLVRSKTLVESKASPTAASGEKLVATSCLNCKGWCPIKVRVVDGRAVKVFGNPVSRDAEGAICPKAHLALQVLYDPDRVRAPLKRTNPNKGRGVDPKWVTISWDEALNTVATRLKDLRESEEPHALAIFRGRYMASNADIMERFAAAYGTPNLVSHSSICSEAEKAGRYMADGTWDYPGVDLENTNYLLLFGTDILEANAPSSRLMRMWGKMRRERAIRGKVVDIDPRYSITAAKADQWIPIYPGTDGALALSLAHVILVEGLWERSFIGDFDSKAPVRRFDSGKEIPETFRDPSGGERPTFNEALTYGLIKWWNLYLKDFTPEIGSKISTVPAQTIRRIAREFATTRPAVAWGARGACSWPGGSYIAYAIHCLNALVGSIEGPGGVIYQERPRYRSLPPVIEDNINKSVKDRLSMIEKEKGSKDIQSKGTKRFPLARAVTNNAADAILRESPYPIKMAIGWMFNWVFSTPGNWRWHEAFKRIPFFVHITPFLSETSDYADIVLPTPTFLEKWGYETIHTGAGFAEARIKQPVVSPLYDTKSTTDIVFELARRIGGSVAKSFEGIGDDSEGFVRYRTANLLQWEEFKEKGVWVGPGYKYYKYDGVFNTPSKKFEFYSLNLKKDFENMKMSPADLESIGVKARGELLFVPHGEELKYLGDSVAYPLVMSSYKVALNSEGRSANNPWAQEIYLVMHQMGWTNVAEINTQTARALGVRDGDPVWVESQFGRIRIKARVWEGIHPGVVAIPYGQGHYSYGRWARSAEGANPNDITGVDYDQYSGMAVFGNTRVKMYKA